MNLGSEIVRSVRSAIHERLQYTCSAGIARNKMTAKLGSGAHKPNQQTIVRNRAVEQFLSTYKFTTIRNLGGKLGDKVVETFNTDELSELLKIPVEQLKAKLGDDTGSWLYGIVRGEDNSEVTSRTQIKSMLSAKSFRPSINSHEQAVKWLRIFVADIYGRLVEEGVVQNKRRPKTMTLHHRQGGTTRSKSMAISQGRKIDSEMMLDLAKQLLGQVIVDGRAWPCANLSLSVGGFEEGVSGNHGIGSFLLRGEDAKLAAPEAVERSNTATPVQDEDDRPGKKRKLNEGRDIEKFFSRSESRDDQDPFEHEDDGDAGESPEEHNAQNGPDEGDQYPASHLHQTDIASYFCEDCKKSVPEASRTEHSDWHFARDLAAQERQPATNGPSSHSNSRPPGSSTHPQVPKSKRGRSSAGPARPAEKGQSRLAFG